MNYNSKILLPSLLTYSSMMCSGEEPAVGRFQGGGVRSGRPVHAPAEIHGPGAGGDGQSVAAEGCREQRLHPTGRGRGAGLHGAALHAHTQHRRSAVRRTQVSAMQNAFFLAEFQIRMRCFSSSLSLNS